MSQSPEELAAIHAEFADPILYTGAGIASPPQTAIYSNVPAETFVGAGASARHVSFEIRYVDLDRRPVSADRIVHDGKTWKPIDIIDRDDVEAWTVSVELAP